VTRLTPTAEMTLGPFFPREFAQGANDLTIVSGKRAEGEVIEISGIVSELDGKPLDNVVVEIWQADAKGRYDNPDFFGWGRAATDASGTPRHVVSSAQPDVQSRTAVVSVSPIARKSSIDNARPPTRRRQASRSISGAGSP